MTIIVSTSEGETTTVEETGVENEDDLQRYIYENPDCIPLDKYKDGSEILILARELPTQSGPIDAIGVDQDGEIYVIETKLFKNRDKRRVMAQVLDYGAGLWSTYRDPNDFVERLRSSVDEKFETGLEQKLETAFGIDEPELDDFLSSLRTNVAEGRFRFVVLMNRIHEPLKDVIRFVNRNSRFDVFGVELDFYEYGDLDILAPALYGAEVEKMPDGSGGSARRRWDRKSFFEDVESRLNTESEEYQSVREVFDWVEKHADEISWGTGSRRGSFNPKFDAVHPSKSIFSVFSDGQLSLRFGWLTGQEQSRAFVRTLANLLRDRVPELSLPDDALNDQHVRVDIGTWSEHADELIGTLEAALSEMDEA